jgi:diguanylate cyclase (GGDEF)-like protein
MAGSHFTAKPADGSTDSGVDRELRHELVRALYATPRSLIGATIVAIGMLGIAYLVSGDVVFAWILAAYTVVGLTRIALNRVYRMSPPKADDAQGDREWEFYALCGAWSFAGLVGLSGAYAVIEHTGSPVELLIGCSVIGYIAGISSRNASRPLITIGQITATCLPFAAALASRGDAVHLALAAFICALHSSTFVMSLMMHETIVARHRAQSRIAKLALRDFLTDLWNRSAFLDILSERLSGPPGERNIGLIAIDLDRFKDVNDTLGHPAGDELLRETARRILGAVAPGDEVARIGGDEFLVMVGARNAGDMDITASRIHAAIHAPITIGHRVIKCNASLGTALSRDGETTLDDLMRHADLALYSAKGSRTHRVVAYTEDLSALYAEHMALVRELQAAVEQRRFELHYQPIVDPRTGLTVSCEALLRWHHPERGFIPPSVFIPLAETTGLIVPLGEWVLRQACRHALDWNPAIKVSINLSPLQFRQTRPLIDLVRSILEETGLEPSRLELEVTETVLIEDTVSTLAIIEMLRREGIGVSLDDFGTGFSSLGYLHDYPFSKLKIDRKFSQNLHARRSAAVLEGIARITRDLGIEIVAEGIETIEQLDHMLDLGVDAIQGYVYSRPVPSSQIAALIEHPIRPASPAKRAARPGRSMGKSAA